jgi:cytochrome c-type biogenesis protein
MTPQVTYMAALLAGLVSFLSPCVLPLVPPYIVYLAGTSLERLTDDDPDTGSMRYTMLAAFLFVCGF